jgi:hypothetical protein
VRPSSSLALRAPGALLRVLACGCGRARVTQALCVVVRATVCGILATPNHALRLARSVGVACGFAEVVFARSGARGGRAYSGLSRARAWLKIHSVRRASESVAGAPAASVV